MTLFLVYAGILLFYKWKEILKKTLVVTLGNVVF